MTDRFLDKFGVSHRRVDCDCQSLAVPCGYCATTCTLGHSEQCQQMQLQDGSDPMPESTAAGGALWQSGSDAADLNPHALRQYCTPEDPCWLHAPHWQTEPLEAEDPIPARLEYLREQIEAERISMAELVELQSLASSIDPTDTLLLEWASVPEFPEAEDPAEPTEPEADWLSLHVAEWHTSRTGGGIGCDYDSNCPLLPQPEPYSQSLIEQLKAAQLTEEQYRELSMILPERYRAEDPAEPTGWHVGHNMPGYLPESDVWHTSDWASAMQSLREDIDRAADWIYQADYTEPELVELTEPYDTALQEIDSELAKNTQQAYGVILPTSTSDHDLGISYWITECLEDPAECLRQQEEAGY